MNRLSMLCLVGGLFVCLGMTGAGCPGLPELPGIGRPPPAIIPTDPAGDTLQRTFRVDLRAYPEARSLTWEFGDGTVLTRLPVSTGDSVVHTYPRSGTYDVAVHLFSDSDPYTGRAAGWIATGSLPVSVTAPNALPEAAFVVEEVVDADDLAQPLVKRFNASRSADPDGVVLSFLWDFGDGTSGEGEVAEHTFSRSGRYVVRLVVVDDRGGEDTVTRTVLASSDPVASFMAARDPAVDRTFSFDASASFAPEGSIVNYEWDFGDGTDAATGRDVRHTYADPEDFTVLLTVTNDAGVSASTSRVVLSLVRLETSQGDIVFEFVDDAPVSTANFLQYVDDGFYEGTIFHRVVPDFAVQGGAFLPDMVPQEGLRDPIVNEFSPERSNVRGTVAVAKVGGDPNSGTSQFFINLVDNSENLDNQNGGFTVFATVIRGMDVADAIAAVPLDGEEPVDDVILIRAVRE